MQYGEIDSIQFGVLSGKEIKDNSVIHVTETDMYERGCPKPGGLADLRLGTIDRQYMCQTCKCDIIVCPGHFGHIELATKIFHVGFMKIVHKVLNCICVSCSGLVTKTNGHGSVGLKMAVDDVKNKSVCPICNEKQPKIVTENYKIFTVNPQTLEKEILSAADVYTIFSKIQDEDCKKIGFDPKHGHPKDMLISILAVPPLQVRPTITMDNALRSQDDLTHKLSEILKTNKLLEKNMKECTNENVVQETVNLLQFHVNTYFDNELPGHIQATQRTGRPIKGICQRLKSKEGRIRNNLMGKRVDFSARTVITAEPNIDLDELGVPHEIAKILTFPEMTTAFNIEILQDYVNNGNDPPIGKIGANCIITKSGSKKDLRFKRDAVIEIGDIVERHMKDGDYVVFNRQPTLHKMSMMGHKVRILKGKTFRLNLSATTPYNADFDGDEMNLHLPQSQITRAEVKDIMMVSKNIVSGQSNKPVMGIVQDALLASRKFTERGTFLKKKDVMNIMMKLNLSSKSLPVPAMLKPERWTGKQVIEMILPERFNYERSASWKPEDDVSAFSETDTSVVIKDSKFLSGTLCKKTLGTSEGGIIHIIWLMYGSETANAFISNIQYITNYWIAEHGFTVGYKDTLTSVSTKHEVDSAIQAAEDQVNQLIEVSKGSKSDTNIFENKINQVLNNAMSTSGKLVNDNIDCKNNINTMVTSGSKGSLINIAQVMGCVGQQNVNGKRISLGYIDRALPHFKRGDLSAAPKGFVRNSYFKGLEPHEYFFHAMGGREGIIDTAVKTSETGYIQRRLVKAMEDLSVKQDHSLRNSRNEIIQFVYGDDKMDAQYLLTQEIKCLEIEMYVCENNEEEVGYIREILDQMKGVSIKFKSPIYLKELLGKARATNVKFNHWKDVKKLVDKIQYEHNTLQILNTNSTFYVRAQILLGMCTKNIEFYSPQTISAICSQIYLFYTRAICCSAEMMGVVAAQSLGEPTTQLTLNSFHFSGISAKSMTLGVPRFKELINVSKNIKTPSMTLSTHVKDKEILKLACNLEHVVLKTVEESHKMCVFKENTIYSSYFQMMDQDIQQVTEKVLEVVFSRKKMLKHQLNLVEVCAKIYEQYNNAVFPIIMTNTSIHILFNSQFDVCEKNITLQILHNITIKGYTEISKTYISDNSSVIETDGTCLFKTLCNDLIDSTKSISNQPLEILQTLGIEAARSVLLSEIKKVLEFDGGYVNSRHFSTLIDTMTSKGQLMSITRHGINRTNAGPLMKCSFEETVDVLYDAATYSELDPLAGVAEHVTIGKQGKVGTGEFDLLFDHSLIDGDTSDDESDDDASDASEAEQEIETKQSFFPIEIVQSFFPE
jgi:DNA-directed RNA polymerase II subunit RPB1